MSEDGEFLDDGTDLLESFDDSLSNKMASDTKSEDVARKKKKKRKIFSIRS
ncbi:hypothetical protein DPMN_031734 [Dreissena polymorpha]|uniref:Uncharacterized protein n=1 Tax=Dreissena polymorpha TaxID=45954 RepID=A0A9D4M3B8_DREPO|nr:hypothetical protein DPMN_031734 [Dreissena polymorpha]